MPLPLPMCFAATGFQHRGAAAWLGMCQSHCKHPRDLTAGSSFGPETAFSCSLATRWDPDLERGFLAGVTAWNKDGNSWCFSVLQEKLCIYNVLFLTPNLIFPFNSFFVPFAPSQRGKVPLGRHHLSLPSQSPCTARGKSAAGAKVYWKAFSFVLIKKGPFPQAVLAVSV